MRPDEATASEACPCWARWSRRAQLAELHHVSEVLITAGELSGKQVRNLVEQGQRRGVAVKVLPSYEQLLHGRLDLRPREVMIEDLLHREPVQLDQRGLRRWTDDRVLMVTGSAGSIGSEICRQLLQFAPGRLVAVDRSENGQFFLQRELQPLARIVISKSAWPTSTIRPGWNNSSSTTSPISFFTRPPTNMCR